MSRDSHSADLLRERVLIVTEQDLIEGTVCYPHGVRLSDALNAENAQLSRAHLPLVDVNVTRIESGRELLSSRFLLVARSKIVLILPKSEIVSGYTGQRLDDDWYAQRKAPGADTQSRRDADLPTLIQQLKETDEVARRRAAEGLGRLGPRAKTATPALLESLKDRDELVRGQSAEALGAVAGEDPRAAVTALRALLRDSSEFVRRMAAGALGGLGAAAAPAVPELSEALKDKEEFVRRSVADALGKIGPRAAQAAPALQAALADSDVFVRHWAAVALNKIGRPGTPSP